MVELHHIIKKSQAKFLEKCKINFKYLCPSCHRGTYGVHGKNGEKLDCKLQLEYQNKLELTFLRKNFTREQIGQALNINDKALNSLCKLMKQQSGTFTRDEIIKACMGGQRVEEREVINE